MKTLFVSWLNDRMTGSMMEDGSLDKGPVELPDEETTKFLEEELLKEDYDITFVHLDDVDKWGGESEFSPEDQKYLDAIEVVDG